MLKPSYPRSPIPIKSPSAKKLWQSVHAEYAISSESDLLTLGQACQCIDRMTEASTALDRDGVTIQDRFSQPKEHPAVETWCKFSRQFLRAIRELGLNLASDNTEYIRSPGVSTVGRKRKAG